MIVVDTSIIAYLALPTKHTARAEKLLAVEPEWAAPVLWRSEFRNVLATYLRKSMITIESALGIQMEMEDLMRTREYDMSSLEVLSLIGLCNCSAVDCEFIALAQGLESRLVTADVRLHRAFPDDSILLTDMVA
jgi:predicted nucleic acid-binding protein